MFYELIYILTSKLTDQEVPAVIEKINALIKKNTGEIKKQENWGKQKLAYPIKSNTYGFYILNHLEIETENLKKLDKDLHLFFDIIRYQFIRLKQWPIKPARRPQTELGQEKGEIKKQEKKIVSQKKVSMEDLDEKLKEILNHNEQETNDTEL